MSESGGKPKPTSRVIIGSTVISALGLSFGSSLIIVGSLLTWRADNTLGLYSRSGWSFDNLIHGDGKITLALGGIMALGLLAGLVFQSRAGYAVALWSDLAVAALALYELIYLFSRQGIVSPGPGLYMVIGGSVAGFLASLGGYRMMKESQLPAAT